MAQSEYSVKKITTLEANTEAVDNDLLVVGNNGTAIMKKLTFANLANSIRDKLKSLTFTGTGGLDTTNKTLPGAINELNTNNAKSYYASTIDAMCTIMSNAPFSLPQLLCVSSDISNALFGIDLASKGYFVKMSSTQADMVMYAGVWGEGFFCRYNFSTKAVVGNVIALPTRSEVNALNTNLSSLITSHSYGLPGVAVNAYATSDYVFDIGMANYTPLGIITAWISAGYQCTIVGTAISGSTATVRILNAYNTTRTPSDVWITVLYKHN